MDNSIKKIMSQIADLRMIRDHTIFADIDSMLETKLIGDTPFWALTQTHLFDL